MLTAISALAIAMEIILIGLVARSVNARRVTIVQVLMASLLSFATMPLVGESVPPPSWLVLGSAFALGVSTAGIQYAINWAQKKVSPTRATLIYSCEPVWAGIFGRMAGERLPGLALLGGIVRLAQVLRLSAPLLYGALVITVFRPWYLAHTALADGIFLVLVGLAALSWVVTLIRAVRETIW